MVLFTPFPQTFSLHRMFATFLTRVGFALTLVVSLVNSFSLKVTHKRQSNGDLRHTSRTGRHSTSTFQLCAQLIANAPYNDIIPFLSEHINPSDMILFVGARTDLPLQLVKNGFGVEKTGFIQVVESNQEVLTALEQMARADPELSALCDTRLRFICSDLTNMPLVCKQSTVDAIVDYGGIDELHTAKTGKEGILRCIDHLQDAVRLGNILICLSQIEKEKFCSPFEERFGWVQELDGDPGEISAWYRGKTNIAASKSNFADHGLKMYVYTNTDNC